MVTSVSHARGTIRLLGRGLLLWICPSSLHLPGIGLCLLVLLHLLLLLLLCQVLSLLHLSQLLLLGVLLLSQHLLLLEVLLVCQGLLLHLVDLLLSVSALVMLIVLLIIVLLLVLRSILLILLWVAVTRLLVARLRRTFGIIVTAGGTAGFWLWIRSLLWRSLIVLLLLLLLLLIVHLLFLLVHLRALLLLTGEVDVPYTHRLDLTEIVFVLARDNIDELVVRMTHRDHKLAANLELLQ